MAQNIHTVVKVQEEEPSTYSGAIWFDTDDETALPSNVDTIDNFHASQTPTPNYILPLNNNGSIDVKDTYIENTTEDEDILIKINDGGTVRNAIQIHGDEGSVSFPRQSYVYATRTTNQTIATSTTTTYIGTTVIADSLSEYNNSTGIFTAKNRGIYSCNFAYHWTTANSAVSDAIIQVNGTDIMVSRMYNTVSNGETTHISKNIYLDQGDNIRFAVWQNSGGNRDLGSNNRFSHLTITKVS